MWVQTDRTTYTKKSKKVPLCVKTWALKHLEEFKQWRMYRQLRTTQMKSKNAYIVRFAKKSPGVKMEEGQDELPPFPEEE